MNKRTRRQIESLVSRAHAILEETGEPFAVFLPSLGLVQVADLQTKFVLIEEGQPTIYTNAAERHAQAIIEDMAETLTTARIKRLEANIENALESEPWKDDESP